MVYNIYMSYSDAILKDRPVYIYNPPEPGPLTTVYKSTPLISDEGNAFLVRSGETFNSYATFSNTLDILKQYKEDKTFTIEFWVKFNQKPTVSEGKFFTVGNSLYLATCDNRFLLDICGYKTSVEIDNWDELFYVVISYNGHYPTLYINNKKSTTISFEKINFTDTTNNFSFLATNALNPLVVSSFAIYLHELSQERRINHFSWAFQSADYEKYLINKSISYFNAKTPTYQLNDSHTLNFLTENKDNINIVGNNFFLNKKIIPGYSNVNTSNNKTTFDSDGYVQANIDKFDMPINDTAFLLKFYFQYNDPNQSAILSVTHQYGTLSLEKNSSYIKLMYNSEELYSYNTLTNSGDYNVGIVIKQTTMDFIVNGTSQGSITCPPLGFLSNVVLGNNSSYNDGYTDGIKYFSVAKSNVNVNSDINSALSHRYTIDLTTENFKKYVYQTGYAETYFLSSDTSEKRSSIQFLSNSSNAKVYASSYYSSGYPLVEVYNNQSIPHYDYDNHIYVKIKVELKSINNYDNPKVSNLNVYTYKDDLIYSVNSSSTISSNTNNSYEIGHSRPLFIKDNFGIKQRSGSSNNSIININNQNNAYQSVSFMFRLDNSLFILSNKSLISVNGNEISLTFIGQNLWTLTPSSGTLYINGVKDATNIRDSQIYHIVWNLENSETDELLINSSESNIGFTMGDIAIFTDLQTDDSALYLYNSYFKKNKNTISDSSELNISESGYSSTVAKWEYAKIVK